MESRTESGGERERGRWRHWGACWRRIAAREAVERDDGRERWEKESTPEEKDFGGF